MEVQLFILDIQNVPYITLLHLHIIEAIKKKINRIMSLGS